ncbi:MAG TPA: hypothetical protein VGD31_05025, partial [Sphingobacteriaceae bacterium]
IPGFYDLHPSPAFPWHELVCPASSGDLYNLLTSKGLISKTSEKMSPSLILREEKLNSFFPLNTFENASEWVNIKDLTVPKSEFEIRHITDFPYETSLSARTDKNDNLSTQKSKERDDFIFLPKSRIIVTKRRNSLKRA